MNQVIEKEISEALTSLNQQHVQCQWYVQIYLLAISNVTPLTRKDIVFLKRGM